MSSKHDARGFRPSNTKTKRSRDPVRISMRNKLDVLETLREFRRRSGFKPRVFRTNAELSELVD